MHDVCENDDDRRSNSFILFVRIDPRHAIMKLTRVMEVELMNNEKQLPRCKSDEQGVDSAAIQTFLEAVDENELGLHSFMLLRHGYVLAEKWWPPHEPDHTHELFSVSKSFTSTAVGLAVEENLLSIHDPILSFFEKEVTPEIEINMGSLRVEHLLTMATGHIVDPLGHMIEQTGDHWVKGFLVTPIEKPPGTHFLYNSGASYMLSAIVHQVSGQSVLDYLQPRLFEPLGIRGAIWGTSPEGINFGGWGLNIKTEDISKFGQLYLQKGIWNEKRILSQHWVEEAAKHHSSTASEKDIDKQQGYGYQFYRCRYGGYCARGAKGQFCIILPDQKAVIAITAHVKSMQAVLDLVWEHLLPHLNN
jgi:CubicO group peptidase (beta-lactamase class C family)